MSGAMRNLRPRAPVNYRVDEDSDVDDDNEAETETDDDPKSDIEEPFEFFLLPQELRDMVYKEALVHQDGVHLCERMVAGVYDTVVHFAKDGIKKELSVNLMATCKRVHYEAGLVLYRQPFVFSSPQAVHPFLINLKPSTIGLLRDITITRMHFINIGNNALLSGLRDAMGLTSFRFSSRIAGSQFQFDRSDHIIGVELAKRFYKDASYFILPFVTAHGIDTLLQVVKFNEEDMRGPFPKAHNRPWSQARKDIIMMSVKTQLLKLLEEKRKSMIRH